MIPSLRRAASLAFIVLLATALPAPGHAPKDAGDEPLLVVQNGRYGYIDHTGRIVIQPQYVWADDFRNGMATVFLCGRAVSLDRQGHVWPLHWAAEDAMALERSGKKTGFLDATGRWSIPPQYENALPFSEGLAAVQEDGKWGFIDATGKEVIPARFDEAYYFNQGVALVAVGDQRQLIDKSGRVLARGLGMTGIASEGVIAVEKNQKWGYLNLDGSQAIPQQFDHAGDFSEDMAVALRDGKAGYIDHAGKVVIPFQFDWAGDFDQGIAPVRQADRSGFIDRSGSFVFELHFDNATKFLYGDAARFWTKDDQFGYVLSSGKVIWGPTPESPTHPPLLGWSEEDIERSCQGVPDLLRQRVASFPPIPRD